MNPKRFVKLISVAFQCCLFSLTLYSDIAITVFIAKIAYGSTFLTHWTILLLPKSR